MCVACKHPPQHRTHTHTTPRYNSVSDDIDEADLDAELAALEDDLEALGEEEGDALATGATGDAMPAYLQPCTCVWMLRTGNRCIMHLYTLQSQPTDPCPPHPRPNNSLTAALPVEPSNLPEAKMGARLAGVQAKTDEYGLPVASHS